MKYLFFALRPWQWVKNFFIFFPLIFGKKLFVFPDNLKALVAFSLFSLSAGVVYIINDIIDIERDKFHPVKLLRPIASAKISVKKAWVAASLLGSAAIILSFALDVYFGYIILIYLIFNFIYSKALKEYVIIDVFCIGGFFLLRIIAGSVVGKFELSIWIIIMTSLLAIFLGFIKRRQELKLLQAKAGQHRQSLSKYSVAFIDQSIAIITAAILIVYTLYAIDSGTARELKTKSLICSVPFVYYGVFRYLYLIHKVWNDGDPTRILLSDRPLQWNILLWISVCILVIYFGF